MKRTKSNAVDISEQVSRLQVLSAITSRLDIAAKLGMSYGGDRDLYEALGYKKDLIFTDYETQYSRQDIAKAIINRPIEATWRGAFKIIEKDVDDSPLEVEFEKLYDSLDLKSKFIRLDKLSTLGQYGVLLLGLDDVHNKSQWIQEVTSGKRELKYVKPLSEGSADVSTWETRSDNERYGLPVLYDITLKQPGASSSITLKVHYTRVIHVTGELLENETEGVPYLKAVFNRLKDLEKVVGGSAEMFWRGARPGYSGKVDKDFQVTSETKIDLQEQIDEYEHNLRRILTLQGIDMTALESQVADPTSQVNVIIQMISAVTGIPKRILTGSERGELSSSQDKDSWLEVIKGRREEYAVPQILRKFVNTCMEYKILPEIKGKFSVKWEDLFSASEKEKVEIGKIRANALKEYSTNAVAQMLLPFEAFLKVVWGLTDEQISEINQMEQDEIMEEQRNSQPTGIE